MTASSAGSQRRVPVREGAERYLLLTIVAFVVAVVGTRWYLQATGYPQVGGGELHIAHMLWGGLLLVVAALLPLILAAGWALTASAILTGAGRERASSSTTHGERSIQCRAGRPSLV